MLHKHLKQTTLKCIWQYEHNNSQWDGLLIIYTLDRLSLDNTGNYSGHQDTCHNRQGCSHTANLVGWKKKFSTNSRKRTNAKRERERATGPAVVQGLERYRQTSMWKYSIAILAPTKPNTSAMAGLRYGMAESSCLIRVYKLESSGISKR